MNSKMINKILSSDADSAGLIIRLPIGLILTAHGAQKLFGWFGGYGLEGTGQFMASVGFEPGYLMALLAGSGEFFAGIALMLGLLTRPAAAVAAFTMLMAMTVHINNGLFLTNNGYEFALSLLASTSALVFLGGGSFSIDRKIVQTINK